MEKRFVIGLDYGGSKTSIAVGSNGQVWRIQDFLKGRTPAEAFKAFMQALVDAKPDEICSEPSTYGKKHKDLFNPWIKKHPGLFTKCGKFLCKNNRDKKRESMVKDKDSHEEDARWIKEEAEKGGDHTKPVGIITDEHFQRRLSSVRALELDSKDYADPISDKLMEACPYALVASLGLDEYKYLVDLTPKAIREGKVHKKDGTLSAGAQRLRRHTAIKIVLSVLEAMDETNNFKSGKFRDRLDTVMEWWGGRYGNFLSETFYGKTGFMAFVGKVDTGKLSLQNRKTVTENAENAENAKKKVAEKKVVWRDVDEVLTDSERKAALKKARAIWRRLATKIRDHLQAHPELHAELQQIINDAA